jgi:hypothetical protein
MFALGATLLLSGSTAAVGAAPHALSRFCAVDLKSLCAGIAPGEGRIRACLESHISKLSESLILARALHGFTVGISLTNDQTTWVIDGRSQDGNYQSIPVGDYTARVTIVCGEQVHTVRRTFKVGAAPHLTFWV